MLDRLTTGAARGPLRAALVAGCLTACAPATVPTAVPAAGTPIAANSLPTLAATATPVPTEAPSEPAPALPATGLYDFCLRPGAGDVLFSLKVPHVEDAQRRGAPFMRVYRGAVGPDGAFSPVSVFADLSDRYDTGETWIERVQCRAADGRVLLTVGNQDRQDNDDSWWAELWLLEGDGRLVYDHALAREFGAGGVAWAPDGDRLLMKANPRRDAGTVFDYDLRTEQGQELEDVWVETVAGPGGGALHWSADGRLAILESTILPTTGGIASSMQVIDVSGASAALIGTRDLMSAVAVAVDPDGGVIVLTGGIGTTEPKPEPIGVFRWDPARPSADLVPLGTLPMTADAYDTFVADLSVLPRVAGDGERIRMVFNTSIGADDRVLVFADLPAGGPPTMWRLSAPGLWVDAIQVADAWLGYMGHEDDAGITQYTDRPFDLAKWLHVIPLSELEPERLDANPAFESVVAP